MVGGTDALVVGPEEFNTSTLSELGRRNFLRNGELRYSPNCRG